MPTLSAAECAPGPAWTEAASWLARVVPPTAHVLVATSGGPDSQALLWWSVQQARQVGFRHGGAIGIDHGLRAAAGAELAHAANLAGRLQVPFASVRVAVEASGNRLAQARIARFAALRAHAAAVGATFVLLGHTLDDRAETLLWHLLRQSGRVGFRAMPRRRGAFLRPLLGVTRTEIVQRLHAEHIVYATDPSNLAGTTMRSRLRMSVWPALLAHEPRAKERLCIFFDASAPAMARYERHIGRLTAKAKRRVPWQDCAALCVATLQALSPGEAGDVVRRWLLQRGVRPPAAAVTRVVRELALQGERPRPLPSGALRGGLLCREGAHLIFKAAAHLPRRRSGCVPHAPSPSAPAPARRPEVAVVPLRKAKPPADAPLSIDWHALPRLPSWDPATPAARWSHAMPHVTIHLARLSPGPRAQRAVCAKLMHHIRGEPSRGAAPAMVVAFAQQRLHGPLRLRSARAGETMAAWGRPGRVRLVKALAEAGIPARARAGWPVLTLDEEVIWLVGIRRGERAPIDDFTVGTILLGWANPTP